MATTMSRNNQKSRFNKLSLKKNNLKDIQGTKKLNHSSDKLDDTFDRLKTDLQLVSKIYSPITIDDSPVALAKSPKLLVNSLIVLDDSSDNSFSNNLPKIANKEPSKVGNVSFNGSQCDTSVMETKNRHPSKIGCWSPAQSIICATPKQLTVPSTPKDTFNKSSEHCSLNKIEKSQKKLLNELYGEVWKSIPTLFKTVSRKDENLSGCTKKLDFDDDDSDKENNIRNFIKENKKLYLTGSDAKNKVKINDTESEKKSKKKLYTEKVPDTPVIKIKRDVNTTSKKLKGKSVTELVECMKDPFNVNSLVKKVDNVCITPTNNLNIKRLSFMGSLADNVPHWRCHPEAFQYRDDYKSTKEKLARRLYSEFNKNIFNDGLDADMPLLWASKLTRTAGTTTNRLIKSSSGVRSRSSSIKLSSKILDAPQRLRDTLVHEMCHAATWLINHELKAGHGPLWKKWAARALQVYPELEEISRCHDMKVHFKYSYKCTKCGYTIGRHSKSLDITKKCCGYCHGKFEIVINKKTKDGAVISTPARTGEANGFAKFVKDNYGTYKSGRNHAEVMKVLGQQFSARKNKDLIS